MSKNKEKWVEHFKQCRLVYLLLIVSVIFCYYPDVVDVGEITLHELNESRFRHWAAIIVLFAGFVFSVIKIVELEQRIQELEEAQDGGKQE